MTCNITLISLTLFYLKPVWMTHGNENEYCPKITSIIRNKNTGYIFLNMVFRNALQFSTCRSFNIKAAEKAPPLI